MMFKATYSPADANNKRKETKWAGIFSMQMSVEMDGPEEQDSSHTGQPLYPGPLVGVHWRCPRASASGLRPGAFHQSWN